MTFHEAYKNDIKMINPDTGVIDSILVKMRKEIEQPTPWIKRIPAAGIAAAAAGIFILVAAAVLAPVILRGGIETSENSYASDSSAELEKQNITTFTDDIANDTSDNKIIDKILVNPDEAAADENAVDNFNGSHNILTTAEELQSVTGDAAPSIAAATSSRSESSGDGANNMETANTGETYGEADSGGGFMDFGDTPDDWSAFVNYSSYKNWPDENLWDGIEVDMPVIAATAEFPVENESGITGGDIDYHNDNNDDMDYDADFAEYDEDCIEDSPPLPEFKSLSEFADMFLTEEHRISSVSINSDDKLQRRYYLLSFENIDTSPICSMLSKYIKKPPSVPEWQEGIWSERVLNFNITNYDRNIFVVITPTDELIITAAGYDGSLAIKLDKGEYEKMSAFLNTLE